MLDALKDWFLDWFYGLLYQLQAGVCNLIDFIKKIFFKLCGLDRGFNIAFKAIGAS